MYLRYQVFKEYTHSEVVFVAEFDRREDAEALEKILNDSQCRQFVPVIYTVFKGIDTDKEKLISNVLELIYTDNKQTGTAIQYLEMESKKRENII